MAYAASKVVKTAGSKAVFLLLVGLLTAMLIQAILPVRATADTNTWVDGAWPQIEIGSQVSGLAPKPCFPALFTITSNTVPDGSFGSLLGEAKVPVCAMSNQLGQYGSSDSGTAHYNLIKPNSMYAYQMVNPIGHKLSIVPVPHQASFFYSQSDGNVYGGVSLRFYDSIASAGKVEPKYGSNEKVFKLNSPLAEPLRDSAGNIIHMQRNWGENTAFSPNGQWLVIEAANIGILRINTQTRKMQLVSNEYNRIAPRMTLAISNDGNSVVRSGIDTSSLVYDLSGCQPAPFFVTYGGDPKNTTPGCRSRDVRQNLAAQVSGFRGLRHMRFSADGKRVSGVVARYNAAGATEHFAMTYSVSGYQSPELDYLALGDSFSSGEGAEDYEEGTDNRDPQNKCHLSKSSYPYLAAQALNVSSFHSVACSGAVSGNYYSQQDRQNKVPTSSLGDWIPGYQGQNKYFEAAGNTSVVTLSMIGNDVGFGDKLKKCIFGTDSCFHFREDRQSVAYEIHSKFDTLVDLYRDIQEQAPDAKVYALGYPQLFGTGTGCDFNVRLDAEERLFARGLATYLNAVIKAATEKAGVQYIDVEHAFSGKQHCDAGAKAVNGLTGGNDGFIRNVGPFGNESYHPNKLGHQLFSGALLAQSDNFTKPMPAADDAKQAPFVGTSPYDALIGNAPGGGIFSRATYSAFQGLEVIEKFVPFKIKPTELFLKPKSLFEAWFNSEPTFAGTLMSNDEGELEGEITVPDSLTPGYHTLHIYGQNIAGEDIDLYKTIYVAASLTDYDGDGIPNTEEKCLAVEPANVDEDRDGIDDACDPEISEVPADTTPPTVTGTPDRQPNDAGWYKKDVSITWSATDPDPSSGAATQPEPTTASQEGTNTYASADSCDPAGNCAVGSLELKLDKTAPDINFTVNPAPNAASWNNSEATVTFTCDDALSGIVSCTDPITVTGDGGYLLTGTATDAAGNTSEVNAIIFIDSAPPTVSNAVTPAANAAGWHNAAVTLTPDCSDDLSGVASCTPPATLESEGSGQTFTSTTIDHAGNSAVAITNLKIDKTAPLLGTPVWAGNPKAASDSATLIIPTTDNLSGVIEAEYFLGETDPGQGNGATMTFNKDNHNGNLTTTFGTDFPTGVYKVTARAKDNAGNWSALASDYLVVYNPDGLRMTGKKTIQPSLANGDFLPGLADFTPGDNAKFGFSVRYDEHGQIHKTSDFQFGYKLGDKCKNTEKAQGCHSFQLNATSIAWLTTQGENGSTGIFQGAATLEIDGVSSPVTFRLTAVDGERLSATSPDHLTLYVYAAGDNPNTAPPIYRASAEVARGNVRIRTE